MNDRFSAQLRQHLLQTANERPADGQLDAIVQRVAVTGQRPSITARLLWNPGRIGPLSSMVVRYGLIVLALVLTALALVLLGGAGPSARTSFEGTWTSIDPSDNSTQTLAVGAGSTPTVEFMDDFASGPACVNDTVKRFTADGTGLIAGTRLHATFPNGGGCGLMTVAVAGVYDYEVATDTLLDRDGVTWTRVRGGGDTGTMPPITEGAATGRTFTEPSATEAPSFTPSSGEPDSACITLTDGGTYVGTVGSLSLTATLAGGRSWTGMSGGFYLWRGPCRESSVTIEASLVETVFSDACRWRGTAVKVETPGAAIAALASQLGHETIGPTDATIGGYPARRLEFSLPTDFDMAACDDDGDGTAPDVYIYDGFQMDPGLNRTIYLVDVDGRALAVTALLHSEVPAATVSEIDAIVASLRIDP